MPATGKTTNLELPLYNGNDTISELISFNGAMEKIDAFAGTSQSDVEKNTTDIAGLVAEDTTIKGSVAQLTQRVQVIENKIPQYDDDTTDVAQLKTDVAANTAAVQGLDTRTTNLETNVNNLQTEQTSMDGRLETAEDQITDLMSATAGLPAVKNQVKTLSDAQVAATFNQLQPVTGANFTLYPTSSSPQSYTYNLNSYSFPFNNSFSIGSAIVNLAGESHIYIPAWKSDPENYKAPYLTINGKLSYNANTSIPGLAFIYHDNEPEKSLVIKVLPKYISENNTTLLYIMAAVVNESITIANPPTAYMYISFGGFSLIQ